MLAGTVLPVKSAAEAKVVLRNGYGINVCSMQAFSLERNSDGICEADPRKRWAHSMTVVGYRTVRLDGRLQTWFRLQQSWGDHSPTGPLIDDMGFGMFDVREDVMDCMLQQGDSFAYGDLRIVDAPKPAPERGTFWLWWIVPIFVVIGFFRPKLSMALALITLCIWSCV